jgi:tetratricopeptide (TPR) repeat protein
MMTQARVGVSLPVLSLAVTVLVGLVGCSPDIKDVRRDGIEQYRSQQYVESMATMRYGLSMKPSDAQTNYYMGLNYRAMAARKFREGDIPAAERELDTAIIYFSQAIKSWPNYQAAVAGKAEALESRGKYLKALDTADAVAYNNRGAAADHYVYAGDLYRDMGDYDSALSRYKLALSTDPNSAKAYASMGRLYSMAGDRGKAVDSYARAHELDPGNPEVTQELARLGAGQSDLETVIQNQQPQ